MTGSAYSGTLTKVTSNQTINATFGEDMVTIRFDIGIKNIENIATTIGSNFVLQYSTNNSSWTSLTVAPGDWVMDTSGDNGQEWYKNFTNITVAAGSTLYLKYSTKPTCVSRVRVTDPSDESVNLSTSSTNLGTVRAGIYEVALSVSYLTLTPTIGSNGTITATYHTGDNVYTNVQLVSGTAVDVNYGSNISYVVTPNSGYAINTLLVNGVDPR